MFHGTYIVCMYIHVHVQQGTKDAMCGEEKTLSHLEYHTSQWRHYERDGVSNHCRLDCLLSCLFRRKSEKISWPLWGESTGDRWIPLTKGQWRGKCFHPMTSLWQILKHTSLELRCRYFDEICVIGCNVYCHVDNFRYSQWWKFCQNGISATVFWQSGINTSWIFCLERLTHEMPTMPG